MIKKIIFVGVLLIMSFSFVGCGNSEEIDFEIGYSNMNTGFSQEIECIVNTFVEWDTLRGDTAQFTELDAKYNEQFFTENALVVYAFKRVVVAQRQRFQKLIKMEKS